MHRKLVPPTALLLPCLIAASLMLPGCAGRRAPVGPLLAEFDRYAEDARIYDPSGAAAGMLETAEGKRNQARSLAEQKEKRAYPLMKTALADIQLALHMARLESAQAEADRCLRQVEEARGKWQEAFYVLEQTESVVARTAPLSRQAPEFPPAEHGPLPETLLSNPDPPAVSTVELAPLWDTWEEHARERRVTTADLEGTFRTHAAGAADEDIKEEGRAQHLYIAARMIQCVECRIREAMAHDVCRESAVLTRALADGREEALRATLDLERGLQEHLRAELDRTRLEARDRQGELYDALAQIEGKYASITQEARGTIVSLADILFDFDKATLKRDVEFNLVRIATILQQFPEMDIAIEGHTDNVGTEEYNLDLSRRRAKAVQDFLVEQGLSESRMTYEGFGMSRPVADNTTEAGRAKNRRVDLVIREG